jgi:hypothetical protein
MTLLKDPPDLVDAELSARLTGATATTTALAPLVDHLVAVYREAWATTNMLPGGDSEFDAAVRRLESTHGLAELDAALWGLLNMIAAALVGSPQ